MAEDGLKRRIRSFVRREGRLTRGQQHALDTLWPRYGLPADQVADFNALFGRSAAVTLEIGFGNGASLARLAHAQPEQDFIGIEVHRPGVGHLLQLAERDRLSNLRIYNHDAVEVLERCIPDHSLARVLILFPDPWHKKRHHKRRLVQPEFIALVASKLSRGGILHLATDWTDYAEHMLAVMAQTSAFSNIAGAGNYAERPAYRSLTKFELRGQRLGHPVHDLVFERT